MRSPGENLSERVVIRPTRLVKHSHSFLNTDKLRRYRKLAEVEAQPTVLLPTTPVPESARAGQQDDPDAYIPTGMFDVGSMSTMRLMAVSGIMRAVRLPAQTNESSVAAIAMQPTIPHRPLTDPLNGYNSYREALLTPPSMPITPGILQGTEQPQTRTSLWNMPVVRTILGLLMGLVMLFLISRFVDISTTISTNREMRKSITNPIN